MDLVQKSITLRTALLIYAVAPLVGALALVGYLALNSFEKEVEKQMQSIRTKGAMILMGLLLTLSALVIYGHHRALGVHLRRLASSMSIVAQGNRGHRFESRGPKEIAWLGTNFNDMLNSIEQAEKQLEEHRRSQHELQMQLRRSEKLAALGRLAAGTAHELGTPLSVINGKAQRALRDQSISTEHRQALEAVRDEVTRMEHIIRQLLNFSHSTTLRHSIAAPARLASSAVAAVDEEAKSNHTEVKIEGRENSGSVEVDAVRVEQALINLLRNAVQSTPGGNVRISWHRDRQYITFRVDDDGPGVDSEIHPKIFEPFFTTKPVGKGTGLGLSVVQTVAEEHGGMIEVEANESGGACFKLSLPLNSKKGN